MSWLHEEIERGVRYEELVQLLKEVRAYLQDHPEYYANKLASRIHELLRNPQ